MDDEGGGASHLEEGESDPGLALVLSDGEELHQVVVPDVGGIGVPVLVHYPLTVWEIGSGVLAMLHRVTLGGLLVRMV